MRHVFFRAIVVGVIAAGFLFLPNLTKAAFNPGRIISDEEFIDTSATAADLHAFLLRRSGVLATKTIQDQAGNPLRVADALLQIGQQFRISPQVLLATLQKEQSIVTDPDPSQRQFDWAMGYGVCDTCGGVGESGLKGFYNQVYYAAKQFRNYIDTAGQWSKKVGGTYTICKTYKSSECKSVILENQATVNLYIYTPYLHGNENFYNIFSAWFARSFPDGTLVRVGKTGAAWYIQNGERRAIQTRAAFLTRFGDYNKILQISPDALANYPRGADIRLPNFSLVQTPDGTTYLLSGDEKRLIQSPEVFRILGFNPEEVIPVSTADVQGYLDGVTISNASAYPAGALVRIKENGGVVWIEQGIWYPILDRQILKSRFPNRKVNLTITNSELLQYAKGSALTLRDGELVRVKGESGVSVISNGLRRGIQSRKLFNQYGYNMKNVLVITPRVAELHPTGEPLPSLGS